MDEVPKTPTLRAGVVAVIGIFGLAWLGDSFIAAHKDVIVPAIGDMAKAAPWTFAFGLFGASVLLYSQAATTRALMPLGMALGIPPQFLIAMFPSVNGYFFIPTYGSLIAAINFDLSGTTRIGKYVLNHSFMIPGIVATSVAVFTGLVLAKHDVLTWTRMPRKVRRLPALDGRPKPRPRAPWRAGPSRGLLPAPPSLRDRAGDGGASSPWRAARRSPWWSGWPRGG